MSEEEEKRLEDKIKKTYWRMDDKVEANRANEEERQINWTERGSKDDERDRV